MCAKKNLAYLYIPVCHLVAYTVTVVVLCGGEHGVFLPAPLWVSSLLQFIACIS